MKTIIYIDAANIILSCKNINFDLDLNNLFKYLKDKYKECSIVFFIGDVGYLNDIRSILVNNNIEICIKKITIEGGKVKANCDVEITNRITVDIERKLVDFAILMTGDGDFAHLYDYILSMGKQTKCIAATFKNTSIFLRRRDYLKITFLEQMGFLEKEKSLDEDETS